MFGSLMMFASGVLASSPSSASASARAPRSNWARMRPASEMSRSSISTPAGAANAPDDRQQRLRRERRRLVGVGVDDLHGRRVNLLPATIQLHVRQWRIDPARAGVRHPHRRGAQLVHRPVPDDLVAVGRLRGPVPGRRHQRRSSSRCSPRCCSSGASCCTSSATRWWRSATASASRASTCGCSAAWPRWSATRNSAGEEFRVAAAGPAVTLLIAAGVYAALALDHLQRRGRLGQLRPPGGRARRPPCSGDIDLHQHRPAGVQPDPRLPARRRPDRPRDRVEGHRQPRQGDPLRRPRSDAVISFLMIGFGVYLALAQDAVFTGIWLALIGMFLGQAAKPAEQQTDDHRPDRGPARGRRDGRRAGGRARRADPRPRRTTSTSCATATPGSRWSTPAGGSPAW